MDAVLWYIRTGGPWRDLPERYGHHKTVERYFRLWRADGLLSAMLEALEEDIRYRAHLGDVDLDDLRIDLSDGARTPWWWATAQALRRGRRVGLYGV